MQISEHADKLRKYLEFRNYSKVSVKNYCSSFTLFLSYFEKLGVTHPDRINSKMVIEFLTQFKEPSTHSGYHSAIKIYYEKIARVGIEKFKYIERPKRNKKLPIVLSQDEIQRMFDVCVNKKHKVILQMSANTVYYLLSLFYENMRNIFNKISFRENLYWSIS